MSGKKGKGKKCEYPASRKAENKAKRIARDQKRQEVKKIHRLTRIQQRRAVSLRELNLALAQDQVSLKSSKILNLYDSLKLQQAEKKRLIARKKTALNISNTPFALLYSL